MRDRGTERSSAHFMLGHDLDADPISKPVSFLHHLRFWAELTGGRTPQRAFQAGSVTGGGAPRGSRCASDREPVTPRPRAHVTDLPPVYYPGLTGLAPWRTKLAPPPLTPQPTARFDLSLTSSTLPPSGNQLLEKSIHCGVEELHPRNGSAVGHGFGGQPLRPFFLTAAANVGVTCFGHIKIKPPNLTGPDAPPTKSRLAASDWKQRMSITEPTGRGNCRRLRVVHR